MPSSCCVNGCFNKQTYDGYSMFGFPNDHAIKQEWIKAIGKDCWEPRSHHRVCEVHFEPELIHFVGSRKELKKNAVPTLFCNCPYSELSSLRFSASKIPSAFKVSTQDHSYSQSLPVSKDIKQEDECLNLDKLSIEAAPVKRKAIQHTPKCNILREPLRKVRKMTTITDSKGIMLKMIGSNKSIKTETPLSTKNSLKLISKPKSVQFKLKLQLQNALEENAKLREELHLLKRNMPPMASSPSKKVKFLLLQKKA